jgi:phosphomannomutase
VKTDGAGPPATPDARAADDVVPELVERARLWLNEDPDADTRAELEALLTRPEGPALAELQDRFSGLLTFGTAGLRGALAAGPNRMNRAVVIRTSAALATFLNRHAGRTAVVGYDARHKSDVFARDTAAVLAGAGIRTLLLPRPLPTPVLAFAVRHLGLDAGVMVTASHNPRQDNGYKVYLAPGSQLNSPADAEITHLMGEVGPLASVPKKESWRVLGEEVVEAYLKRVAALPSPDSPRDLAIAYTPLHGVGRDVLLAALKRAGFAAPQVVAAQGDPDPDFPTVAFPNPEEPGAMDLALQLAAEQGSDIVLAHDPDADRCAVACGGRVLRGDEVGALLAIHLLRRDPLREGTFATSIVSSMLLARIAQAHDVPYAETLTGFKWIARVDGLRFGYEEALGYCVDPDAVLDKDGIAAALLVAELAASLKADGRTLLDLLDEIAREYGVHATDQLTVRCADPADLQTLMRGLRSAPPSTLGGRSVQSAEDLSRGLGGLPATDALRYRMQGGARVIVRPSGTEPKLKVYLEVVVPVQDGDVSSARRAGRVELEELKRDVSRAVGLT